MAATTYITNAFSVNMLSDRAPTWAHIEPVSLDQARELSTSAESAVGHFDTAMVFTSLLGRPVEHNRVTLKVDIDDAILLGQHYGPRLPEGATRLPPGAQVKWFWITFDDGEVVE